MHRVRTKKEVKDIFYAFFQSFSRYVRPNVRLVSCRHFEIPTANSFALLTPMVFSLLGHRVRENKEAKNS